MSIGFYCNQINSFHCIMCYFLRGYIKLKSILFARAISLSFFDLIISPLLISINTKEHVEKIIVLCIYGELLIFKNNNYPMLLINLFL